jgi:hypothetical protein
MSDQMAEVIQRQRERAEASMQRSAGKDELSHT